MKLAIGLVIAMLGLVAVVVVVDNRVVFADPSSSGASLVMDRDHHARIGWRLVGKHASLPCNRCHTLDATGALRTTGLVATCESCHASPHPAVAVIGPRSCDGCHPATSTSFEVVVFAHPKVFLGKHARIACEGCHPSTTAVTPVTPCESCHSASPTPTTPSSPPAAASVSHHGRRFAGKTCESCHGSLARWSANAFRHTEPWFGQGFRHSDLVCRDCHRGKAPDDFERLKAGTDCTGCHAHRNVHADDEHPLGKYRNDQCLQCHTSQTVPRKWHFAAVVHGPNGDWPLVKGHKSAPCSECHVERNARGTLVVSGLDGNCGPTCHEDALHRGALGSACDRCHVPGTWDAMKFDHRTMSSGVQFELRGEHANQLCDACHVDRNFSTATRTCVSCHESDDAHRGSLGRRCETCHRDTGAVSFDHARAPFPLVGKHRDVSCDGCHPDANFKSRPTRCSGCHPVPPFHREARSELAWYDDNCEGCHSPRGW